MQAVGRTAMAAPRLDAQGRVLLVRRTAVQRQQDASDPGAPVDALARVKMSTALTMLVSLDCRRSRAHSSPYRRRYPHTVPGAAGCGRKSPICVGRRCDCSGLQAEEGARVKRPAAHLRARDEAGCDDRSQQHLAAGSCSRKPGRPARHPGPASRPGPSLHAAASRRRLQLQCPACSPNR